MQADDKEQSNHTITLVCSTGMSFKASPTTIDLNEAERVVTIHYGAINNAGGSPRILYPKSSGPLKARFTRNTITFVVNEANRHTDYTINRLTGIIDVIVFQAGQQFPFEWTCHVGKAQF
jgi:hypothetical protein